jgi:hypothetical protein
MKTGKRFFSTDRIARSAAAWRARKQIHHTHGSGDWDVRFRGDTQHLRATGESKDDVRFGSRPDTNSEEAAGDSWHERVSQKAARTRAGIARYSFTRRSTRGTVRIGNERF